MQYLHWLLTMTNVNPLSRQKFDETRNFLESFNTTGTLTKKETLTGFDR